MATVVAGLKLMWNIQKKQSIKDLSMECIDVDVLMTEHYAWRDSLCGRQRVFKYPTNRRVLVDVGSDWVLDTELEPPVKSEISSPLPKFATAQFNSASDMCAGVPGLGKALQELGLVLRLRTVNLWEAIVAGIIRQVIRASQAKALFHRFCDTYGEAVSLPDGGSYALVPDVGKVRSLSKDQFNTIGMAFQRQPLQDAAEAFKLFAPEWYQMAPSQLVPALQVIPRVGEWTAQAVTADFSGDFSFYPYHDLAVRTWAAKAAPSFDWPSDSTEFTHLWRNLAAGDLHALTLLTLAWGDHHDKTSV